MSISCYFCRRGGEWMMTFLSGAGGAALVAGVFALIQWALNRHAKKQDDGTAMQAANCAARGSEIEKLTRMVEVLCVADRTILYDRIKHLGKSYIARGYITVEELEDLEAMHHVYHDADKLDGNGFLDELMAEVEKL